MVLFIIGAALLVACNAAGQGVETAPLPTSTVVDERASAAAVQLLAATEMSATAEATLPVKVTLSVEAYPAPESPSVEATLSLAVPTPPLPTETPLSYPIHTPLPTATPFPAQPVAAEHLPALTHDLLFIQDATLMRWNHRASQIEPLFGSATASRRMPHARLLAGPGGPVGGLSDFTISPDAGWVIFSHVLGPEQSRIVTLNLETLETRVLAEGERLHSPALSGDGRWAIFKSTNIRTDEGTFYYLATSGSGEGGPVVDCAAGETPSPQVCQEGDDLWILEGGQRTQVALQPSCDDYHSIPHEVDAPNASDWSPSGRYRHFVISGEIEGSMTGLADMELGWELEIPGSYSYVIVQPEFIWLRDERLIKAADNVEIFHIEPESENKLVLDRVIDFDEVEDVKVISPVELEDGRIGFALVSIVYPHGEVLEFSPRLGLYLMDSADGEPRQVNQLPPNTDRLLWVPDGSGALVAETRTDELLYAPTDGGALYDLRPVIPQTAGCFAWVPNP
jgi:hypothetical protein